MDGSVSWNPSKARSDRLRFNVTISILYKYTSRILERQVLIQEGFISWELATIGSIRFFSIENRRKNDELMFDF